MTNEYNPVERHRGTIEKWADTDLPLAEEMQQLLEKHEKTKK